MCYITPMLAWNLNSLKCTTFLRFSTLLSMQAAQTQFVTEILPVLLKLPSRSLPQNNGDILNIDNGELYHCMCRHLLLYFVVSPAFPLC